MRSITLFCGAATRLFRHQPVLIIATFLAIITACIVPPDAAYLHYVDWRVIGLLFCLMVVVMAFRRLGFMDKLALRLIHTLHNTRRLTFGFATLAFFTSMVLTNDVALISIVPLTMMLLSKTNRLDVAPRLVTLEAIAANLGSMATPLGNPQNLFLYTAFQIPTLDFFATMIPLSAISLMLLVAVSSRTHKEELPQTDIPQNAPEVHPNHARIITAVTLFILAILAVFRILPVVWLVFILVGAFLLTDPRTLIKIDFGLLATFIAFFIFVGNLQRIDAVNTLLSGFTADHTLAAGFTLSQFISNVPAAILLSGFTPNATELLAGVNIGGLGTLVASLASLIAFQGFNKVCHDQKGRFIKTFTTYNVAFAAILLVFRHFFG